MPKLINAETKAVEDLPHELAGKAFLGGTHGLVPGEPVTLKDADGQLVQVDPTTVYDSVTKGGYQFPTNAEVHEADMQNAYGEGALNSVKAGLEGAARGISFGASDYALPALGVTSTEAIRERRDRNPIASTLGDIAGVAAPLVATAGAAAPAEAAGQGALRGAAELTAPSLISGAGHAVQESVLRGLSPLANSAAKKVLTRVGAKAAGSAVEGALYSGGQMVSEAALGDPDLSAERIAANLGLGAALGFGIGGALAGAVETASLLKSKFLSKAEKAAIATDVIRDGANTAASAPDVATEATVAPPQTPEELQAMVERAGMQPVEGVETPNKARLAEITSELPDLKYPVHGLQLESLSSPSARDTYKAVIESAALPGEQGELGRAMQGYEALQKRDALEKTRATIDSVAPGAKLDQDVETAGRKLIDGFNESYQAEKEALAPAFEKLNSHGAASIEDRHGLLGLMEGAVPGASKYIEEADGKLELAKWKSKMPFSREVHGAINDIVDAVNDDTLTLGELRNVRDNIRDKISFDMAPREKAQLNSLRRNLMDFMQEKISSLEPDLETRELFKRYAINEGKREELEKLLGGKLIGDDLRRNVRPEDVMKRLFSSTNAVGLARDVLEPEAFNRALGNFIKGGVDAATDPAKGGFSSNKFGTFLRKNAPELREAFRDSPQVLRRLENLTDFMRILPDSPPINPSGTAKTLKLLDYVKNVGSFLTHPVDSTLKAGGSGLNNFAGKIEAAHHVEVATALMRGLPAEQAEKAAQEKMARYSVLKRLEGMAQKTSQKIQSGTRAIFNFAKDIAPALPQVSRESAGAAGTARTKEYKDNSEKIMKWANNPEMLLDHLEKETLPVYPHAPGVTEGLQRTAVQATTFLHDKLPLPPAKLPLSREWKPSQTEVARFNRYLNAVEDPTSLLKQIKTGTLSVEGVEAVRSVYPRLYDEMTGEILDKVTSVKGVIPYKTRLMLSLFMGQDMDESTTSAGILANQQAMLSPQGAPAPKASGGASKLTLNTQALTPMQQSAQRA